jgi:hypothetical protein
VYPAPQQHCIHTYICPRLAIRGKYKLFSASAAENRVSHHNYQPDELQHHKRRLHKRGKRQAGGSRPITIIESKQASSNSSSSFRPPLSIGFASALQLVRGRSSLLEPRKHQHPSIHPSANNPRTHHLTRRANETRNRTYRAESGQEEESKIK